MVAPMVNPYETRLIKEERRMIWGKFTTRKRIMYFVARRFPKLLAYFYYRSFLSGNHGRLEKWLSLSLGKRVSSPQKTQNLEDVHLFQLNCVMKNVEVFFL